ncbi:alpha-amylase [Gloeophyllum trabeum ATCC 11539]|uniref:alpha-amylase n=1 Tax=Gloeophyllum trabeum (strain ATCC 11539 / FP-39264 / Madison 617) TaxID=670483 RepID=S7RUW9_GLOTA|nr:alpha-amylase [Gloeophyllum trabeum ATCC 11539]EPQ58540.1 alpha-amylase [Gloeophyllum trabeum ATCC 11539]
MALIQLFLLFSVARAAFAATAEEWRGRSIYQIIVDRFALPDGADPNACDTSKQTWCGGNWKTIKDNLDYIQDAGFTAIWISPISQNYQGERTPYGDPYHGYWIQDASKLNEKFGTADDLKALSDEVHRRGMYLMVDVVVNNVMALSNTPDLSKFLFKEQSQYHPYCPVDYSNITSEQNCWLGDTNVYLPDVNTQDSTVVSTYQDWVKNMVQTYNIDGLRIDAAKHVNTDFWPKFCGAAGVFCIGEVYETSVDNAAQYQGEQALDSILNYPLYAALTNGFAIPGPLNLSAIADTMAQSKQKFKDPGLLGNFLENQDVPRWGNLSVDPQSLYNAMAFTFMSDGIPIVYYGQEQYFSGGNDPYNREPLWPSKYQNTTAYQIMSTLNKLRNFLINGTDDWLHSPAQLLTTTPHGLSVMKGNVISILTNIGSPPANLSVAVYTPFENNFATTDVLSCRQWAVGSNGTVDVEYTRGGQPVVLVPSSQLEGSGLCGYAVKNSTKSAASMASGAPSGLSRYDAMMTSALLILLTLGSFVFN